MFDRPPSPTLHPVLACLGRAVHAAGASAALLVAALVFVLAAPGGPAQAQDNTQRALVAGGCFWCVESDFRRVEGVRDVRVGFAGGDEVDPSYRDVVSGRTGHLEAAMISFDASVISYDQILHLFMRSIDPLDAGGQFCDRGRHYTTAIFALDESQRTSAEAALRRAAADLGQPVVTALRGNMPFYEAEDYHQNYANSTDMVMTRFGPRQMRNAYRLYREGCGRDARVRDLWGDDAPFVGD
ncbi:MAG: peptide-methionine (S)-S-oxide reductase MsrA [Rhodobacteraceae bacterium]|nr:peptide-methionine (S)-S-oxide reductase MsrA [Paracoccaceae bacterium]